MHVKSLASTQRYSYQFTIMMQMITAVPGSPLSPFSSALLLRTTRHIIVPMHTYITVHTHTHTHSHTRYNSPSSIAYPLCLHWLDLWRSHVYPERYLFEKPPSRVAESNVRLFLCFPFILETGTHTRSLCIYANRLANTVSHCLFLKMMQLARHPFFCWCSHFLFFFPLSLSFLRAGILTGVERERERERESKGRMMKKGGGGGGGGGVCSKSTKVL